MSPGSIYLEECRRMISVAEAQLPALETAAGWFAQSILGGRVVHMFGSGHSRILVEEMWPRYGSFPGFHPIVELSLSNHHQVVGCNGQRQAMFLENVSGLAERILRNFEIKPADSALVVSSSGCNVVPVEMAAAFKRRGVKVVAIVSRMHAEASSSQLPDQSKLSDHADLVLDTGAPVGDAMVSIDGLDVKVAPGSTVGGCMLINALKAEVARVLSRQGVPPIVLAASAVVGKERSKELFDAAYDQYARSLAQLLAFPKSTGGSNA